LFPLIASRHFRKNASSCSTMRPEALSRMLAFPSTWLAPIPKAGATQEVVNATPILHGNSQAPGQDDIYPVDAGTI
jgi:hypothetical protein